MYKITGGLFLGSFQCRLVSNECSIACCSVLRHHGLKLPLIAVNFTIMHTLHGVLEYDFLCFS